MRADRLISIMLLLQTHNRITTRELARRLEVSDRTIHRDMDALTSAGIPVYSTMGAHGGWSVLNGFRTSVPGLSELEMRALLVSSSPLLLTDLGLKEAADTAMLKLIAALPAIYHRQAEQEHLQIYLDSSGWFQSEESVPHLQTIHAAIRARQRLSIRYARGDGSIVDRLTEPLGLVAKAGIWYFMAGVEDSIRSYRVSRVEQAIVTGERFEPPPDFDLREAWEESMASLRANLPQYPVTIRVSPDAIEEAHNVGRYASVEHAYPPDEDGWIRMMLRFEVVEEAMQYVLRLSPKAEALEPAELRERIIAVARSTVDLYSSNR